jgi:hypothetical protein
MGIVVSVNAGLSREVEWRGKTVRTAIWKQPVQKRVFAGRLNLVGDGQAELIPRRRATRDHGLLLVLWLAFQGSPSCGISATSALVIGFAGDLSDRSSSNSHGVSIRDNRHIYLIKKQAMLDQAWYAG